MATAVSISDDGTEVVVSYPSEPVLALASKSYSNANDCYGFVEYALNHLKSYLLAGAVDKGHRGEVIVRLLNTLAMDKCMQDMGATVEGVKEVPLISFLKKFDHNRTVSTESGPEDEEVVSLSHSLGPNKSNELSPAQQRALKAIGGIESLADIQQEATTDTAYPYSKLED